MRLVLASSSVYRARLLHAAGHDVVVDPPQIDERALDPWFISRGADVLAVELARRKAAVVAERHQDEVVVAGDQVGVVRTGAGPVMLTKAATPDDACAQLERLSGTTHELVNGLVVRRGDVELTGIDVQRVTFRRLRVDEIRAYVEQFAPFDTSGSYRLEDDDAPGRDGPFVTSVEGEDPSGVLGLPMPLLSRLLEELVRST